MASTKKKVADWPTESEKYESGMGNKHIFKVGLS